MIRPTCRNFRFPASPGRRGQISLTTACILGLLTLVVLSVWTWRTTHQVRSDGKTELVVWNMTILSQEVELALHQFEELNPQYKVTFSSSVSPDTASDGQRLLTAIAGNVPPDLMMFDRFAVGEWAARGAFTDLTPLIDTQKKDDPYRIDLSQYYPWTLDEVRYARPRSGEKPGLYGLPASADIRLLYSNADHLRQAGFVDEKGEPRPPRTWEELRDAATKLTRRNANGQITRLGFAPNYGNSWLYIYAFQAGGNLLSDDKTRITLDSPPVRRALRFMMDIYDDLGGAAQVNAFQAAFQDSGALDAFIQGSVSMKIDGTWSMQKIADWARDMDFRITPAPLPADRRAAGAPDVTWAGGNALVIPSTSRQKEGAFKLMQFLTSRQVYRMLEGASRETAATEGKLYLPQPKPNRVFFEELEKEWIQNDPSIPKNFKAAYAVIRELLPKTLIRPPTPVGQLLWNQHVRAMDAAVNHQYAAGRKDKDDEVEYCLALMQKDAQRQLDSFLEPPPPHEVQWGIYFVGYALVILGFGAAMMIAYKRHRLSHNYRKRELGAAMLFASPWLLGIICLTGGPILFSVVMSFTRYDVLTSARYVGIENYHRILSDEVFYTSLYNTAVMVLRVPLVMAVGLGIAMLLNRQIRGIGSYRTAFFVPSIMPAVAASLLWLLLLNPSVGVINAVLNWLFALLHLPISPPSWLQDANWSKPSIMLMSVWGAGGGMIIWLAGLQSIPRQLYEAAEIDGASAFRRFTNVTLPMLSPYILFNAIIGVIATMQIFAEAYIMTSGGPADSTLFYAYYLFRNAFQYFRMGYASALAWILFTIVLALTLLQLWASKKWVHYERT